MNVTFDFKRRIDAEDCHTMFTAFGWSHTMKFTAACASMPSNNRVIIPFDIELFGRQATEAVVFAPVQITVE